ncbi:pseudouridine synthase [Larkinella humicola]|uniref:Pseudouridine synthase n=1 Tax=Larkinella humicola TaxID=2607654 RepID=A0A5N1JI44_9BACT|nr:pseudouridine synthase [Larkinella humicola]KAA9354832.1 pseudouridine synthase [Larkinella humicola]
MSKKREEPQGRREGRSGGYGQTETTNKFYSNVVKRKDSGDRKDERKERSFDKPGFDKPRGERPASGERRFDDKRSERPRTGGSNYAGSRPDRPRFERSDDRRSSGPSSDRPDRNRDERPRSDSPRGGRFEGGGPRRDFDRPRGPRDENKEFRRDDRPDNRSSRFGGSDSRDDKPRYGRNGGQSETRNSRFGSEKSHGDRSRNTDSRPQSDRPERRESRFGSERSYGERPERSREGEPRDDRNTEPGAEPRERREFDRPRRDDRPSGGERREFDRPRRDDRGSRDERPADRERRDFDRPRESRDESKGFSRDRRPGDRERREFDRPRQEDQPSRYDRPRRDDSDDATKRKIEDSRGRQVGRSRAPEYDIDKMKEQALGSRGSRDKRPKRVGHEKVREQAGSGDRDKKPRDADSGLIRLNRYVANAGICSRRDADELIAKGDVSVNGKVVTEMGYKVQPTDVIKYGTRVLNPEKMTYVLLNKPKDYITTTEDPEDRNTVMDLVAGATPYRIYPVGRLDRNTTGLLLLTNDGELVEKLTHPSNEIKKVYQVELDKPLTNEHFEAIRDGFELEDGYIKPDDLGIVTPDAQVIGIEIHSGRNRIVRRIFEHFDYVVTKLDRTVYAGLNKKELPRGTWRYLNEKEVIRLKFLL